MANWQLAQPAAAKVGWRLRSVRLSLELSQTQVADACGIPKARTSRYENGHVMPSIDSLVRYCEGAFGITLAQFFEGFENIDPTFTAYRRTWRTDSTP